MSSVTLFEFVYRFL